MPCSSCMADANCAPLWQTCFVAQLEHSQGVYFICSTYLSLILSLPPFWSGTCSLVYVTPHKDLARSNASLPLPVYTQHSIHHAALHTPLFLAPGLAIGLAGAATGGTSLHKFQRLSTDTAGTIGENCEDPLTSTIPVRLPSHYGSTKSLGPRLTDHRAGGHMSLSEGRMLSLLSLVWTCPRRYKGILERATRIWGLGSTGVWSPPFCSWLLPFLGPVMTILLGLLFGPCMLQLLLAKCISNRHQQVQAKLMLIQGWKPVSNMEYLNLDQVERDICSARQDYAHSQ